MAFVFEHVKASEAEEVLSLYRSLVDCRLPGPQ